MKKAQDIFEEHKRHKRLAALEAERAESRRLYEEAKARGEILTGAQFAALVRAGKISPAGWATPKAGDACESGTTDKQQAGWDSLSRQAQRAKAK